MRHSTCVTVVALFAGLAGLGGAAQAQADPPGQAGRLAFVEGVVSFHDDQQGGWGPAVINTPLTSGDAIWTEPDARSEISLAGSRVRLEGSTHLDLLDVDDSQIRLQIDRGRIDIKASTFEARVIYRIVTPRGTIMLQQQGDYYVEAGSIEDATRLGVRSGIAQFQAVNGERLSLRAGEVGEISGTTRAPKMRLVKSEPPPPSTSWAARDRQIDYTLPAQYLSAGVTGYEDLNSYGSWSNDSQYGHVWSPRSVPADWQPYRSGHWSYVKPWGWTWIDDQPWGYAPYHYGRWAHSNNRWVWVPPQRELKPVYAPALVAFIGGIELALSLGNANDGPVGWFPLGPRETYVPPYTSNRDYYNRINRSAQVQQSELDDRWQRSQRREPPAAGPANARVNQRFATVVPAQAFVRSQPVARAALTVAPEKIAAAPVALVSTPPAPGASLAAPLAAPAPTAPPVAKSPADPSTKETGAEVKVPAAKPAVIDVPTLGKPAPAPDKPTAPGPKIVTAPSAPAGATAPAGQAQPAVPPLVPRTGNAPPQLRDDKDKDKDKDKPTQPRQPEAKAPATTEPPKPRAQQPVPTNPPTAAVPKTEPKPPVAADPIKNDRDSSNTVPVPTQPAPSVPTEPRAATPAVPSSPAAPVVTDEKKGNEKQGNDAKK